MSFFSQVNSGKINQINSSLTDIVSKQDNIFITAYTSYCTTRVVNSVSYQDWYPAIAQAITDTESGGKYAGRSIYFPPGIYYVGSTINMGVNTKLIGAGIGKPTTAIDTKLTQLKVIPLSNCDLIKIEAQYSSCQIRDLSLYGDYNTSGATSGNGIVIGKYYDGVTYMNGTNDIDCLSIANCSISSFVENGIKINRRAWTIYLRALDIHLNGKCGIFNLGTDNIYTDMAIYNNYGCGIFDGGGANKYSDMKVYQNGMTKNFSLDLSYNGSNVVNDVSAGIFLYSSSRNGFSNVEVQGNYYEGVRFHNSYGNVMQGITFDLNGLAVQNLSASVTSSDLKVTGTSYHNIFDGIQFSKSITTYPNLVLYGAYFDWNTYENKMDFHYGADNQYVNKIIYNGSLLNDIKGTVYNKITGTIQTGNGKIYDLIANGVNSIISRTVTTTNYGDHTEITGTATASYYGKALTGTIPSNKLYCGMFKLTVPNGYHLTLIAHAYINSTNTEVARAYITGNGTTQIYLLPFKNISGNLVNPSIQVEDDNTSGWQPIEFYNAVLLNCTDDLQLDVDADSNLQYVYTWSSVLQYVANTYGITDTPIGVQAKANNMMQSGTTTNRPKTEVYVGLPYFDTTLGKPIYCKTTSPIAWVDATGTTV